MPTDWSIWMVFNPGAFPGRVKLTSWTEEFTEADIKKISTEWQPTGTAYIDYAKLRAEEAEKQRKIQAELERQLKLAKEEQERILLQKQAEAKKLQEQLELQRKVAEEEAKKLRNQMEQAATIQIQVMN